MPSFTIDINFQLNTDSLTEAEEALQGLRDSATEVEEATEEITGDGISEMGESASETAENIKEASDSMEQLGNKTEEANEKMQETAESSAGIGTALAGIGGAIGLDAMITKADNINTSWNQLSLTFDGTGVSMDTLKAKSSELSSATGRSGTQVRDYFNQMGIAGITNVDLLSTSFENMAGRAYQTGSSVESMEGSVQRMVMSGNAGAKMLSNLGISSSDLAQALGVTEDQIASTFKEMSTTERLEALNKAMGDGTEANEMYKNSYAGLKQQASMAIGSLMSSIGQSILPVIIPAIQSATNVIRSFADMWKGLPAPVTSVFGVLGGGVVAVTTLVGSLGVLGKVGSSVVDGLRSMKSAYDTVRSAMSTAKIMTDALRNAESLSEGVRAALAIATGAETTAEGANAAAKTAATGPTAALAVAENSLLLPILLVVGAIVGLIAVLYYLYNNNEMVRNAVNSLANQFWAFVTTLMEVANQIVAFVTTALDQVMQWVNGTTDGTNNLVNLVMSILFPFPTLIANVLGRVLPVFVSAATGWINSTVSRARTLVNNVYNVLTSLPSKVSSAVSGVTNALTKPFRDAWNTISPYINDIQNGINTLNNLNPFSGVSFEGFNANTVQYEGFESLNGTVSNTSNNANSSIVNNFNINGIIEEEASQYIVDSVNGYMRKQNLIRGV